MTEIIKYNYLVNKYKNRIFNYSHYMMRNRMDADDITQEVLIRIWKNMGKFSFSSAKSWIMKTTHNLCLDYLRNRQVSMVRHQFVNEDEEETLVNEYLPAPDETAHVTLMEGVIDSAISRLPENLRSIFIMYEIQGFKYEDISRILEIPLNSVKVYLMRARKKLQEELKVYKPLEMKQNG
jgi:RNA polymerase sigma-70 factor, ECF subfamily